MKISVSISIAGQRQSLSIPALVILGNIMSQGVIDLAEDPGDATEEEIEELRDIRDMIHQAAVITAGTKDS